VNGVSSRQIFKQGELLIGRSVESRALAMQQAADERRSLEYW
jgi:hypothetical protein